MSKYTKLKLSARSKQRREGIDPRLIEISDLAIQISLVDFGHPKDAGLRTAERQNELYGSGASKADGYNKLSNHQSGKALDFYAFVAGRASWQEEHLALVAAAFLQAASILGYKVTWGGLWERRKPKYKNGISYGWDMPHIELLED